jgi:hypothetical protein
MQISIKMPLLAIIFLLIILDSSAQTAARQDTILLSVHNNAGLACDLARNEQKTLAHDACHVWAANN